MFTRLRQQSAFSVALLTAGHFFSDFYVTFLPGLLPMLMERLGLSLTISGLLVMVYSAAANILQPLFGYWIDKRGYSWLILLTVPLTALFISLAATADSVAGLFILITLAGLASALFHPLGSALLGRVATGGNKSFAMSWFIGGGNVGVALAPAVVIYFLIRYGPQQLIWLTIPGFLISAAFYMTGLHRIKLTETVPAAAAAGTRWYRCPGLLKLNAVMGLRSWPQAVIPNFLPIWLGQKGFPPALAGTMLTVFLAGAAFGSVFGGYAADKLGRKNCIAASLLLCIPALWLFLTSREVTALTWAALAVSGAALQGTLPASVVWAQDMLPSHAAMASGMMLGLSFGLGGLGAAVTGAVADWIGLEAALLWMIAPLLLALAITLSIAETPVQQGTVGAAAK
ncbi:MAG: MFS transporter [Sporomusaceae bacterium]|nr:MFS transporter [Sporomusaceae bacterium]